MMKPDFYQALQSLYLGDIYYFSIEMAPVLAENLDLKKKNKKTHVSETSSINDLLARKQQ